MRHYSKKISPAARYCGDTLMTKDSLGVATLLCFCTEGAFVLPAHTPESMFFFLQKKVGVLDHLFLQICSWEAQKRPRKFFLQKIHFFEHFQK